MKHHVSSSLRGLEAKEPQTNPFRKSEKPNQWHQRVGHGWLPTNYPRLPAGRTPAAGCNQNQGALHISFLSIVGIRDVHIKTNVGHVLVLKVVQHVLDLRLNLISGVALDLQGYKNNFKGGKWKLSKGSLIIARGYICGTLYKTHVNLCRPNLNAVEEETSPNLRHRKLGHMSEKGLRTLAQKEAISFVKDIAMDPREHCLFGKQH
ncbi:hypothetical protein OSB04_019444 [Centaurea solstitialis]|uniref:GAG-pre-integrase domain-containing protein n=1 Tax=Centaurea solstitialis TaxID=347529 RepID=A0AA38T3S6_9ASTR|nr:hypothetical protein OSB04_019444 [Centaurea solstitialis]